MNEIIDLSGTHLDSNESAGVIEFCSMLKSLTDIKIYSIALYGSALRDDFKPKLSDINILIITEKLAISGLNNLLEPVIKSSPYHIAPFFLPEQDLQYSIHLFPAKFLSIQMTYKHLWGKDILKELKISHDNLKLRCEQEIMTLSLKLTRYYINNRGLKLMEMMTRSMGTLLENLRVLIYLIQKKFPSRKEVLGEAEKIFQWDKDFFQKIKIGQGNSFSDGETEKKYEEFRKKIDEVFQKLVSLT